MDLHNRLLEALVPANIKVVHRRTRSLRNCRPYVTPAGDTLEQAIVKSGRRSDALGINDRSNGRNIHNFPTTFHSKASGDGCHESGTDLNILLCRALEPLSFDH